MANMMQGSFWFDRVPYLKVGEGEPTRNWHKIEKPQDAFEEPEWACLTYLQQWSKPGGTDDQDDLISGVATVSLSQMCTDLCMASSSLHRTLHRLTEMGLIKLKKLGRSRRQHSEWIVFNSRALEYALERDSCTHYCMKGSARRLCRAQLKPQS